MTSIPANESKLFKPILALVIPVLIYLALDLFNVAMTAIEVARQNANYGLVETLASAMSGSINMVFTPIHIAVLAVYWATVGFVLVRLLRNRPEYKLTLSRPSISGENGTAAWLVLFAMYSAISGALIHPFLGEGNSSSNETFQLEPLMIVAGVVYVFAIAPFIEELVFRGYAYGIIRWHFGPIPAILSTSVLFSLMHSVQYSFDFAQLTLLFFDGVFLALCRERTGNLWIPVIIHCCINIFPL